MPQNILKRNQKSFFRYAPFLVGVFLLALFSCNSGKGSKIPTCVKLTRAQIQKWVDKGYTDPTNPNYMTSVEFTTAKAGPDAIFRVFVIGVRGDGNRIPESLTELTPVDKDACVIKLPDFLLIAINPRRLSDLQILKKNGTIIDSLEYLKLVPVEYLDTNTKYEFLAYENYNIMTGGIIRNVLDTLGYKSVVPPCPPCPNCIAPCPPPKSCVGTPCEQVPFVDSLH